jgi:hypothetical protein
MTRRSKRELDRALDDLDGSDDDLPDRYVIRRHVVDGDGEVIDIHTVEFDLADA